MCRSLWIDETNTLKVKPRVFGFGLDSFGLADKYAFGDLIVAGTDGGFYDTTVVTFGKDDSGRRVFSIINNDIKKKLMCFRVIYRHNGR